MFNVRSPFRRSRKDYAMTQGHIYPNKRLALLSIFILVFVGCLTFLPALNNGFVWDDEDNLVKNTHFRGLTGSHLAWMFRTFHDANYHPLSWVSFGIDYLFWSLDPFGYHLTNLVLHLINVLVCYLLMLNLLHVATGRDDGAPETRFLGALWGALFFAVHPLRVETVAWLSTRGDLMCAGFYMATVIAYMKQSQAESPNLRRWWYFSSLIFFGLSLLSRAWGVTLPVILLILDGYPLRRLGGPMTFSRVLRLLIEKIPYILMAAAGAVLAILAKTSSMRQLAEHGMIERILQSFYGLLFYPIKTVLPIRLSPLYLLEDSISPFVWPYGFSVGVVIVVTIVLVVKARQWPWALAAWFTYAIIVSPLLGIVQSGPQMTADRYTYLSGLPFTALLAGAVCRWSADIANRGMGRWRNVLQMMVLWSVIAVLSVSSIYQIRIWRNSLTLWTHTIRLDPDNPVALWNRGLFWDRIGDRRRAMADYSGVIRLTPENDQAYTNRGNIHQLERNWKAAREDFDRAIELNRESPEAYASRGVLNMLEHRTDDAIADLNRALDHAPKNWQGREKAEVLLNQLLTGGAEPTDHRDAQPPDFRRKSRYGS